MKIGLAAVGLLLAGMMTGVLEARAQGAGSRDIPVWDALVRMSPDGIRLLR